MDLQKEVVLLENAIETIRTGAVKRIELINGIVVYHVPTQDGGLIRIDIKCKQD